MPELVTPAPETTLGLKYSMGHFYAADNGELADPPQWLRQSQEKLAKLQQRLSRVQPGSKNYQELVQKYRLLHEHIANQRRDFVHQESRRIANAWDAVCVRSDDLAELARKASFGTGMKGRCGPAPSAARYTTGRSTLRKTSKPQAWPNTKGPKSGKPLSNINSPQAIPVWTPVKAHGSGFGER